VYANVTHSNGDEIMQDLKLRTVPVSFTARFLPFDRDAAIQPYVGAGIVAIKWHYSEAGEFVAADSSIFPQVYVANGTAVGPTVLAGVRAPLGAAVIGGDVRRQRAQRTGLLNQQFLGDKNDLGGWTENFTFGFRF
jgi:outer membrane protein W